MFENIERDADERGQVGIGTLIVFIALVLVAAIAAGVLINTAGFLQNQAESTGQESTNQVSDRLIISSVTGTDVLQAGDSETDGDIEELQVTVSLAPGASPIDLKDVTYEYLGGSSVSFSGGTATSVDEIGSISAIDSTDSNALLVESGDKAVVTLLLDGTGDLSNNLDAGDDAELKITTSSGGSSIYEVNIPDPDGLADGETTARAVML